MTDKILEQIDIIIGQTWTVLGHTFKVVDKIKNACKLQASDGFEFWIQRYGWNDSMEILITEKTARVDYLVPEHSPDYWYADRADYVPGRPPSR